MKIHLDIMDNFCVSEDTIENDIVSEVFWKALIGERLIFYYGAPNIHSILNDNKTVILLSHKPSNTEATNLFLEAEKNKTYDFVEDIY
jgi:hypothetical protein